MMVARGLSAAEMLAAAARAEAMASFMVCLEARIERGMEGLYVYVVQLVCDIEWRAMHAPVFWGNMEVGGSRRHDVM